jgi:DNA polymerase IIIc chi subunit
VNPTISCVFHDPGPGRRERILFEIVEHAYNRREKLLVYTPDQPRAAEIDRILWILKQEAFIPHKICLPDEPDPGVSVAIVTEEINPIGAGILVADGHCSIEFACTFSSVHEFVIRTSPELQEACRERYRAYKERKITVEHVKE